MRASRPGWRAARAALSPAMLVATDAKGDYAFLNLKGPAFDLTDRGVAGRAVAGRARCLRLHRARRLSHRRDRASSPRCCATRRARPSPNVPLTLVVERPDGVEYRRIAVPDQGVGGRSLDVADHLGGADRHLARARLHRSEASGGRRDHLPGRGLRAGSHGVRSRVADRQDLAADAPAKLTVDGRYPLRRAGLRLDLEGEMMIGAGQGAAGLRRLSVRPRRRGGRDRAASRSKTCRRPTTTARRTSTVALDKVPATSRPLEAKVTVRLAEAGGRAVERNITLPIVPTRNMIGVKPLFSGRSLGEGENAELRRDRRRARRQACSPAAGCATSCSRSSRAISIIAATAAGSTSRSSRRAASPTARIDVAADKPGRISAAGAVGPLSARSVERRCRRTADLGRLRRRLLHRSERRHAGHAGDRARQAGIPAGRHHDGRRDRAHRRPASRSTSSATSCSARPRPGRAGRHRAASRSPVGRDWGTGAYVVATLRRPLDAQAQRMPGRAIGVQWFSIDRKARTLALDMTLPALHAAEHDLARAGQDRRASAAARRRASSSPRSMSASST